MLGSPGMCPKLEPIIHHSYQWSQPSNLLAQPLPPLLSCPLAFLSLSQDLGDPQQSSSLE